MPTIKIKRGKRTSMPALSDGEMAFTTDSKELYIGSSGSNIKIAAQYVDSPTLYTSLLTNTGLLAYRLTPNPTLFKTTNMYSYGQMDFRGYNPNLNDALGEFAVAFGYNTKPLGMHSTAIGYMTQATADHCIATGFQTLASASKAMATGSFTTASGDGSCAFNWQCIASGANTAAFGEGTKAGAQASISMGRNNKITASGASFMESDALAIGNGTDTVRSNAFRITFGGAVYGLSTFNSTGADFAEYFEWSDKNPKSECRLGLFVKVVNGDKIAIANSTDEVLGIISATPTIVGNSNSENWEKMYVKDKFGRIIHEENEDGVLVPKINPDFDNSQPYISRENRPEWDAVGIIGRIKVIDKGACCIGGFCRCGNDGFAIPSKRGYRVLKRISNDVIEILFK